jgi:ABC-2 type transport system permease protein
MKKIFAIAWKDAIIRFATSWELVFFIVLPLAFTLLLAGGAPSGEADDRIRLVVVDQANTDVSREIVAALEGSTSVRPELLSLDEAETQFRERRASSMLVLPPGLTTKAIQGGTAEVEFRQQPNNLNATVAARAIQAALRRVSSAVNAASNAVKEAEANGTFEYEADRQAYFQEALELAQKIQFDAPERFRVIEGSKPEQVEYDPRASSSAGQLITWVFIPLFGISAMFAYERERGTLRRILTTPTSKATYLTGTIVGQVAMALVQMALLILFGVFVMKLPWDREPLALSVLLTTSALAAGAFGTAMGTFVRSESQANGLSIMAGMVMALMGGCWYPIELFPKAVQTAVKILPTTWAMQGMLDLSLRGAGLTDILPNAGVLLGFAVLFLGIGVWRFRYE